MLLSHQYFSLSLPLSLTKQWKNVLTNTWWLKTTEMYPLTVLEARVWNQGVTSLSSRGPGDSPALTVPLLVVAGFPWHSLTWGPVTSFFVTAFALPCPLRVCAFSSAWFRSSSAFSYKDTCYWIRAHMDNPEDLKILNWVISLKTLFPNKVTFPVSGIRMWPYLFRDHHSTHYRRDPESRWRDESGTGNGICSEWRKALR